MSDMVMPIRTDILGIEEIREFIRLHRLLYSITPGTPQPSGLGEEWGTLKQRVYGTLAYAHEGPAWDIELNDRQQRQETLDYVRSRLDDLKRRVSEAGIRV